MFVKPAPGLRIPDPDLHDFLPEQGREVQDTPYWQRRLSDRDVIKAPPVTEKQTVAELAPSTRSAKE